MLLLSLGSPALTELLLTWVSSSLHDASSKVRATPENQQGTGV
jgi:hypothetical protein